MRISIITVCFNESEHIAFTLDSILKQTSKNYELIVCDGGSTDNTYDIVLSYQSRFEALGIPFYSRSVKDGGIYFGMNMGIDHASGSYCVFMNGGDGFYSDDIIESAVKELSRHRPAVLYGNCLCFDDTRRYIYQCDIEKFRYRECINHQSAFIKTAFLKKRKYDTSYRLCADFELWAYLLSKHARFRHFDKTVACFRLNGASSNFEALECEMDAVFQKYHRLRIFTKNPSIGIKRKYRYDATGLDNNLSGCGWSGISDCGVWGIGQQFVFSFFVIQPKRMCLEIDIADFLPYYNSLHVNNQFICPLEQRIGLHRIVVEKQYLKCGNNQFSIQTKDFVKRGFELCPQTRDGRRLNLQIRGTALLPASVFQKDDCVMCYGNFSGWGELEVFGRWTITDRTDFGRFMKVPEDFDLILYVMNTLGHKNQLFVNDRFLCNLSDLPGEQRYQIPRERLTFGRNCFSIRSKTEIRPLCESDPCSGDTRKLNLQIHDLRYHDKHTASAEASDITPPWFRSVQW